MIELRHGTLGPPHAKCHILDITGTIRTPDEAGSALTHIADNLNADGKGWGSDGNAIVVMTDDETEAWAIGLAVETIGLRDEWPITTILIGHKSHEDAVCIYTAEREMEIGDRMLYEPEVQEVKTAETAADEPANGER